VIGAIKLGIRPDAVRIIPAEDVFRRRCWRIIARSAASIRRGERLSTLAVQGPVAS
jgi:hypothetical protein